MEYIRLQANQKQIIAADIVFHDYPSDIKLGCQDKELILAKNQSKSVPEYIGDWSVTYMDDRLCIVCDRSYSPLSIQFGASSNVHLQIMGIERPIDISIRKASAILLMDTGVIILDSFEEPRLLASDKRACKSYNVPGH